MGRCATPSHRVEYTKVLGRSMFTSAAWRSAAKYGAPGMGRPTVANLAAHVASLNASMLPGGCNEHIARAFGETIVLAAQIVHQASGDVVARYAAPAATLVEVA